MKFFESSEFKELQKQWYEILNNQGFEDIEKTVGNEEKLKKYEKAMSDSSCKLAYYQALTQHLYSEKFDNIVDKLIITLRADGIKTKDISKELRENGLRRSHRETIRYIIRKYEVRWGLRSYKPSQMCSKREKK